MGDNMKGILLFCLVMCLVPFSIAGDEGVRPFLQTGNWYPASRSALSEMMNELFSGVPEAGAKHRPRALIVPHAGLRYSGRCAASAFSLLKGWKIDRVIVLGVAHRAVLFGACVSDFRFDRTPLGDIRWI